MLPFSAFFCQHNRMPGRDCIIKKQSGNAEIENLLNLQSYVQKHHKTIPFSFLSRNGS